MTPTEPPDAEDSSTLPPGPPPDFFSELKRRKVYRARAAYLAVAFAVVEEGGIYNLRSPDWNALHGHPRFQAIWDRVGLPGNRPEGH